jgi:uncharacterized protein (TIGR03083 family)
MIDFLDAIRRESYLFYATADAADPTLDVPSCPDWNIADLIWHLGEVHWFWATDIEARASDPAQVEKVGERPPRPSEHRELIAWGRTQADRLIHVLEATGDDVPVWTWALDESDHSVRFIRRHQVQEAAVHRWDIQTAARLVPAPIAQDVASDSIDEFLAITLPWCIRVDKPLPDTVHIHCADTQGEWFVHGDGRVERIHARGAVAIRGAASDVLLALFKRIPIENLEIIGDAPLARRFVDAMSTD